MKGKLPAEAKNWIKASLTLALTAFLALNPLNLAFVASLNTQEWLLFHVRDVVEFAFSEESALDEDDYYLATGNYENQEKNEYFGAAKGKNLIIVQLESFQNMVVGAEYNGQEITPRMNEWMKENGSLYFKNFFQQIGNGNTSDAEFAVNNSIIGALESFTYRVYENNFFRGLPWILKDEGYQTAVLHGFDKKFWNRKNAYPGQGIDTFISDDVLVSDEIEGIGGGDISGISDRAFYEQSAEILKEMQQDSLFYSMLISLSSHHPFKLPEELQALKIQPEDEGSTFGNYINSTHYADECLGVFFDMLKENGLYEQSLIVVYGDHFGLVRSDERTTKWLGRPYDYDVMMNIPLLIHIPGYEAAGAAFDIAGGQTDLLPTVAWLLGIEKLDTMYFGQNLLTAKEGFVAEKTHLLKGSFIKDDVVFEMSRDGIFGNSRAWSRETGEPVSINGMEEDSRRAVSIIEMGDFYLEEDVLRKVYVEGKGLRQILMEMRGEHRMPERMQRVTLLSGGRAPVNDSAAVSGKNSGAYEMPISQFAKWMRENPRETVLVDGEGLYEILNEFDVGWSGKVRRKGIAYEVKKKVAARYADMQERMIPLVRDLSDWTKIESLGYDDMLFLVDEEAYTSDQIETFVEDNRISGVVLKNEEISRELKDFLSKNSYVYAFDPGRLTWRFSLKAEGMDGVVLQAGGTSLSFPWYN
ncbi:MAG: LTA synthase family protein [Clostridiales Family XIII bacterium]|nr:LTA synthase family protein [Clostridiales Family XIII bacterium]